MSPRAGTAALLALLSIACSAPASSGPDPAPTQTADPADEPAGPNESGRATLASGASSTDREPTAMNDPGCAAAVALAVEKARALHAQERHATPASIASIDGSRFECAELAVPLDLDDDGTADVAVTERGGALRPGANDWFLFRTTPSGPRYVGHVRAHPMSPPSCHAGARSHGLCDLSAGAMMVHGETETHVYRYDGTGYRRGEMIGRSAREPPP